MDNEVGRVIYEDLLPGALAEGRYVAAPEPCVVGKGLQRASTVVWLRRLEPTSGCWNQECIEQPALSLDVPPGRKATAVDRRRLE